MDFLEVLEAKNLSRNTSDNTQLTVQRLVQLRRQRDALKIQLQTVETMVNVH